MDDTVIIQLYWSRNQDAIAQTELKYGAYCFSIADHILQNRADSEECVSSTWLHAWNAIPPQRPEHLKLFLAKITRNLSFNRYNELHAHKRGSGELPLVLDELAECVDGRADVEHTCETRELGRCISSFLHTLPPRDAGIFIRRYFYTEPVTAIARQYGLSENHVSVILNRIRRKLKEHLIKEGYCID